MNSNKRKIFLAMCVLPALILFTIFSYTQLEKVSMMSLYEWSGISGEPVFVGLDNFKALLNDRYFKEAFGEYIFHNSFISSNNNNPFFILSCSNNSK